VRGIWVDMNEPSSFIAEDGGTLPNHLPVDGGGDPATMAMAHNVYGQLEAQAVREGMLAAVPERRPFVLSRAGYAGIQRYAAVWTGDAPSAFYALQDTLPMLLGLGVSGVPFVGSDVGGYSGGASPELFARWMQLGALSPLFRSHVTDGVPDQEPWSFGIEVTDISREIIGLRYALLPYLYSLHAEAWRSGAPPLRPLVWEFQADAKAAGVSDQAMLGPFLLAAPVLEEGATTRTIILPAGRWFEERSGAVVEGPTTITVDVTLAALPLYVREGAIVPRAPVMQWSDQAPVDPLTLDCYPGEAESAFTLYEDAGDGNTFENGDFAATLLTLSRTSSGARLTVGPREGSFEPPPRRVLARFRRVDHPATEVRIAGVVVPEKPSRDALLTGGHGWFRDEADLSVTVSLPETPGTVVEVDADMALAAAAPPVSVRFEVKLPPGTPKDAVLHVATDFGGWEPVPVGQADPDGVVRFELVAPRGQWFHYKFTRGAWDSVEKWPGCVEATDRYAHGAAHPLKQDTVWAWADLCR
jgi:alpha-glucosidase